MKPHSIVNVDLIQDEQSFHDVFARALGFPAFYGRNWDAWIDSVSDWTRSASEDSQIAPIGISGTESFSARCPELLRRLVECAAFVNCRSGKGSAILAIVFE